MPHSNSWFRDTLQLPEVVAFLNRLEKERALQLDDLAEAGKPFVIDLLAAATGQWICVLASSVKQQDHLFSEAMAFAPFASRPLNFLYFPEMERPFSTGSSSVSTNVLPDLETQAEILNALRTLQQNKCPCLVITTEKAALQKVPSPSSLKVATHILRIGDRTDIETLTEDLTSYGYEREAQVSERGEFAQRGGIVDLFPLQGHAPVRIEFNGDEIESMRLFDVEIQTSVTSVSEVEFTDLKVFHDEKTAACNSCLKDYLPESYLIWREHPDSRAPIEVGFSNHSPADSRSAEGFGEARAPRAPWAPLDGGERIPFEIFAHDFLAHIHVDTVLQEQRHELLLRHWKDWIHEGYRMVVCCNNEGEERRLQELIGDGIEDILWVQSPLLRGFIWPSAKLVVLSDAEIFGRYQNLRLTRLQQKMARARSKREVLDFSQFHEGDCVVHVQHGIGRFLGMRWVEVAGCKQEALTLEYRNGALLHVPVEQAHLVGRYVGIGNATPTLDELGGSRWEKTTLRAQQAVMDYAAELLKMEAERKAHQGFAFAPDNEWQKEFEESFLFKETPDQLAAIIDTKQGMESNQPMDRLICGDVGFGKTEVAIRAAFKAVMNGKQVAVLTPTTLLAQQHEQTFRERMADYPVHIDLLSRFRSRSQQRKTLAAAREGAVDILIGTHRLLQPDVAFKNLGLVVVDEEQRFGVKHKERFKQTFRLVDILTLSATPIPRTLYLSLVGAKDVSVIETPPPNRLPVETMIAAYDERLIRSAIERELARGGQVYFLHNRVHSIQRIRDRIVELVPHARVEIGHGQMDEDDLEAVMTRFVSGEIDVLVATTIIESGLDIPSANTMIIDRADRFGMADLYQLRGRVGRGAVKAYAYLLLPPHLMMEAHARKRISAIKQYSQLGAGFKVAMRDLEIRGAGNILGTEQSGHATAIGFDLYCQLLKETLARMKGEKVSPRIEVRIRLDFLPMSEDHASDGVGAYIPRTYMMENHQRIEGYRKLAEASNETELQALADQWQDRFGKLSKPIQQLLKLARMRIAAALHKITSVEVEGDKVMLQKGGSYIMIGGKFPRLKVFPSQDPDKKLNEILNLVQFLGG